MNINKSVYSASFCLLFLIVFSLNVAFSAERSGVERYEQIKAEILNSMPADVELVGMAIVDSTIYLNIICHRFTAVEEFRTVFKEHSVFSSPKFLGGDEFSLPPFFSLSIQIKRREKTKKEPF